MVRLVFLIKILGMAFLAVVLFSYFSKAVAATKVRYVTSVVIEPYHFPLMAAQEQGIWKKYGLTVDWIQLRGDALAMKALTAGQVDAGTTNAIAGVWAVARGVPLVIIASLAREEFFIYVKGQGPIRTPSELKGKRIAVSSLGGTTHAYGQVPVNALGLGKEVKFVATGGIRESVAAFRAGTVDGVVSTIRTMIKLKLSGDATELVSIQDYLPKEWADFISFVHRHLASEDPTTVRSLATALVEALKFLRANPGWLIDKMKTEFGRTDQEARLILERAMGFTPDGKLSRREVENVSEFVVQYGLVPKGSLPPVEQYFAPVFPR